LGLDSLLVWGLDCFVGKFMKDRNSDDISLEEEGAVRIAGGGMDLEEEEVGPAPDDVITRSRRLSSPQAQVRCCFRGFKPDSASVFTMGSSLHSSLVLDFAVRTNRDGMCKRALFNVDTVSVMGVFMVGG